MKTRTARLEDNRLTITIDGKATVYTVEDGRADPAVADPCVKLTKEDGESYHVAVTEWGVTCSCGDCHFRSRVCKHILGLRAVGVMK